MGYSFRLPFHEFVTRYKVIAFKFHEYPPKTQDTCQAICAVAELDDFQVCTDFCVCFCVCVSVCVCVCLVVL